jgi:hypothetical protein
MDPKKLFIDNRLKGNCSYCGANANSRDHIPSRVLLDEPYPENLPIAESCDKCNTGFSVDEEYLACLIECIVQGTTQPNNKFRAKVAKTLKARPSIATRIESGKVLDQNQNPIWGVEFDRVRSVVLKLARGHMSYELGIQHIEEPIIVDISSVSLMTEENLEAFYSLSEYDDILFPEVGSRAFVNLLGEKPNTYGKWCVVQDGRYMYAVGQSSSYGDWAQFILSDYLTCRVVW